MLERIVIDYLLLFALPVYIIGFMGHFINSKAMSVFIAGYDGWAGYFYDKQRRILYVAPLPWLIVKIQG